MESRIKLSPSYPAIRSDSRNVYRLESCLSPLADLRITPTHVPRHMLQPRASTTHSSPTTHLVGHAACKLKTPTHSIARSATRPLQSLNSRIGPPAIATLLCIRQAVAFIFPRHSLPKAGHFQTHRSPLAVSHFWQRKEARKGR